jgi:hypothetical protein
LRVKRLIEYCRARDSLREYVWDSKELCKEIQMLMRGGVLVLVKDALDFKSKVSRHRLTSLGSYLAGVRVPIICLQNP